MLSSWLLGRKGRIHKQLNQFFFVLVKGTELTFLVNQTLDYKNLCPPLGIPRKFSVRPPLIKCSLLRIWTPVSRIGNAAEDIFE